MSRYDKVYMVPLKMNPEIRDMWIAALLSGAYKQGKLVLHSLLRKKDRWCCLGVLCDLAAKNGVPVTITRGADGSMRFDGEPGTLPRSVQDWAGLDSHNPWVYGAPLSEHNDGEGLSDDGKARRFSTIAAMIAGTYKER